MTVTEQTKMKFILGRAHTVLGDLFSRSGRMSVGRFKLAYLAHLAVITAIGTLSLLFSSEISFIAMMFCIFFTFFVVANIATKRHRDTLPLRIEPLYPFRIFSSNPFADQSGLAGFCAIGHGFTMFSLLSLIHLENGFSLLQFLAFVLFVGTAAATLATRFLWVAPSYPRTNKYGPNPHEVTP